jgi:hypothetical protein
MTLYEVDEPKRDFAIGDTWAAKMSGVASARSMEAPQACIVCGAPNNACTGDTHDGTASSENASDFKQAA